jgi:hypothetical protein
VNPTDPIITPTFRAEDGRAVDAIARKRDDLERARELSPSLVPSLEAEITACDQALDRARSAAVDYERERSAALRATALRQQAQTELHTSQDVEPEAASRIVHAAACATYIEGAYQRRAGAAHSAATSGYGRAAKDISERNAAVTFAERLAGAVVDFEQDRLAPETRPTVIAWLPLVLQVEGRAAFARSVANRTGNRSYPTPPPVEDFDLACRGVFAGVQRLREQAARQAAELSAFG